MLLDNVRLNRPLGADFELVSGAGNAFETYRQSPTALPDSLAATEDAPATVTAQALLANDFPARGIDASTLRITGIDGTDTQGVVTLANGQVTYDPRGRLDFLAEGQIGADTFRYAITDANGGTDEGEVTVTVTGLNDAPVANLDTASAVENGAPITIDVLANDDDVDSDDDRGTLRIVAASAASGAVVTFAGAAGAGIVYHPSNTGAFDGLGVGETGVDAISYTIEDSHGARASGSVSVIVAGRNDAPTAGSDQGETNEDTAVTLAVLSNDTDPDLRDRLSISAINGTAVTPGAPVALASGAIVIANLDGTLRYDPAAAFSHLARGQAVADTFSYTAADGHGGAGTATVLVTVNGRNDAPIPGADALATDASTRLTVAASTLLSNDTDPDAGDGITLIGIDTSSTLGTVNFDGATVTYDPNGHFRGLGEGETATDTFTYRIADHDGAISSGSVAITIRGLKDPPTASDDSGSTDEDTPLTLHVLANDTDPDVHDTLTIASIDTSGTRGQVTVNLDGSITYDPRGRFDSLDAGQTDHDSFTYRVSDGHGGTDDATVTVAISGKPDSERLVDSFEAPFLSPNRTSSVVTTEGQYQETDGAHGLYRPTDGQFMARLEAYGLDLQLKCDTEVCGERLDRGAVAEALARR